MTSTGTAATKTKVANLGASQRPFVKTNINLNPPSYMANNYGNAGGYPSTTGRPSGGNRSNGSRK